MATKSTKTATKQCVNKSEPPKATKKRATAQPKTEAQKKTPKFVQIRMMTILGWMESPTMSYSRAQVLYNMLLDRFGLDCQVTIEPVAVLREYSTEFEDTKYREYLMTLVTQQMAPAVQFVSYKNHSLTFNIDGKQRSFALTTKHQAFPDALRFDKEIPAVLQPVIERYNEIVGVPQVGTKASVKVSNGGMPIVVLDDGRKFELRPVE